MALSLGLDTAVKALRAHQLAVDTASHNIANANSPGFSRQRVLLRPLGLMGSDANGRDAILGRTGFGVDAHDVNRVRDVFLDFQARQARGAQSQYASYSDALQQTELVFNDPTDDGMGALLSQFWSGWQDVVNDPESSAARTTLVNVSTTLATRIQRAYGALTQQRANLDQRVAGQADAINGIANEIAQLNFQVKQVELAGDSANDLRDRRDLLLDQLSEHASVSYSEQPDKTVVVYLGTHELVTGNIARAVEAVPDAGNPGMKQIVFAMDGEPVATTTGELRGLLDARDTAIPGVIAKLNALAGQLITSVNGIHAGGYGLDNSTGRAFFAGSDASNIAVDPAIVASPNVIATAAAAGKPGDGSVALQIADLQRALTMNGGTITFDQHYRDMVGVLGADVSRASGLMASSGLMADHVESMRQSVSGVNIDEEVTNLNAAQHAYEAAARVITTIDSMLDTLINNTGLVGR